jgi:hypothetical protein
VQAMCSCFVQAHWVHSTTLSSDHISGFTYLGWQLTCEHTCELTCKASRTKQGSSLFHWYVGYFNQKWLILCDNYAEVPSCVSCTWWSLPWYFTCNFNCEHSLVQAHWVLYTTFSSDHISCSCRYCKYHSLTCADNLPVNIPVNLPAQQAEPRRVLLFFIDMLDIWTKVTDTVW